jgi:uncharacterized membrane protein YdfJ with MMPL/SSD domain
MLQGLADLLFRRRRSVLALSVVVVLVAGVFGGPVFGVLESEGDFEDPGSESVRAREDIARASGANSTPDAVVLVRLGVPASSPGGQARLDELERLLSDPGVAQLARYRPGGDRRLVSNDGDDSYLVATFRAGADEGEVLDRIERRLEGQPDVVLGGNEVTGEQVGEQVSEDIARAELLAFPILFLLSLFVFRGVVAALLPLAVGMTAILISLLAMRVINEVESMSIFSLNLITGLGLGLAIDYSLFMVSRFREELEKGLDTAGALRATVSTAGRTVLFSAVTVAAALASLLVFPLRFLYSMGIGGAVCALAAAVVSLTLLPALLAVLGHRVNALTPRRWRAAARREAKAQRSGFWYRLSRGVMRRPVPVAAGSAALLIALGLPFLGIRFTGVDPSVLPADSSGRVVDEALREEFPANRTTPIYAAARAGDDERAQVAAYADELARLDAVAAPPRVRSLEGVWRVELAADEGALGEGTKQLVREIRAVEPPFEVSVGGETALFLDQQRALRERLPLALGLLALTTLVILFLMTGSVLLPVKALVMNLLTLSAAFGLLVLIFQDGRLETVLGYTSQGAIESSQPILLFAVAFGLSTDYGVFLLTRIKEEHDRGASNEEAVALGLQRTGRIVTFAALLFTIAIGAFVTSQIIFIKQLGLGTALAVLIDATIVRALLVPSLMRLLGPWNWWAPAPLARLHARLGFTEAH